ncbi:hypothetical protein OPQ81_010521 [Rhizoctonia solani]|nr:hypothetical protein OPQ81_010521 [Rhizoctonia solani]
MAQPFDIAEILCLICEQAQRSDLARLLTTSRLFFDCAAPIVWSILPRSAPVILMRLLPDGDTHLEYRLKHKFIRKHRPVDAQSLTRFNLYAPYVKQLAEGLGSHRRWKKLFKLVDTRPILPNLKVFKVSISSWNPDPAPYIAACLTPTLVEINYSLDVISFMEPQHFSNFVSNIAQQCPNIRSLKLGYATRRIIIGPIHAAELANSLGQLYNLRALELGLIAFDAKVLTALSSLPNLESLIISEAPNTYPLPMDPVPEDQWKRVDIFLPHDSFPNLQHLGIDPCFDLGILIRMWNIASFVQNLTSVSVRMGAYKSVTELQFRSFIRSICQNSPFISTLFLSFPCWSEELPLLSPEIMDNLAQLPLQHLRFQKDDNYPLTTPRCDSERFALTFSRIEYLRILGYCFTFKDLIFIAKHMHQLHQLWLKVEIDKDWPSRDELSSLTLTPSPRRLYFELKIAHTTPGDERLTLILYGLPIEKVEAIALGLHKLWPKGVTCGTNLRPDRDGRLRCTDAINAALRRLREVDGHGDWEEVVPLKHLRKSVLPWLKGFDA